jgi:hypothetical protein
MSQSTDGHLHRGRRAHDTGNTAPPVATPTEYLAVVLVIMAVGIALFMAFNHLG